MIEFSKITSQIIDKLSQNEYFEGFKLISAFEPRQKPTVPKMPAVVCGISKASAQTAALGENMQAGQVTAFADIYAPFCLRNFDFQQTAVKIFQCLCSDVPVSIGAGAITVDDETECFVMRLTVTFSDEIKFD